MTRNYLILIIVIIILLYYYLNDDKLVLYKSSLTNKEYLVNDNKNKDQSAKLLSIIELNMYKLKNSLYVNRTMYPEYGQYIELLNENLTKSRTEIKEKPDSSSDTSYSINKGEELVFCLKSKKTGQYHNIDLLMYVVLHEMAHMACPEIGHTPLFSKIFRFLTERAIEMGIYTHTNYVMYPTEYCGLELNSSIIS